MGGKSSSTVVGYWYHPAFHMGISLGPIDALLEIRGGDKTAWSGNLTQSGTIHVQANYLWGGEKDQGGIAGDFDVMFGEPTQMPNAYLTSTFGSQQPAWRGLTTIVSKGGRYGAMNPYPQKISYKGVKITHGWDGDPGDGSACWYPEKAAIPISATRQPVLNAVPWVNRHAGYYVVGGAQEISGSQTLFQGWWHGYIDSFRITHGVARYPTATYAVPTAAFGNASTDPYYSMVVLLLRMLGTDGSTAFVDDKGHTVTAHNGAAISTAQSKFGGSSAYFDGIDDYLSVAMGADEDLGSGPWTMDAWVWLTSAASSGGYQRAVFGYGQVDLGGYDTAWWCSGNAWAFQQLETPPPPVPVHQNIAPFMDLGRWAFVSICFDGSRYWLHQDGQLVTGVANGFAMNPAHTLYYARTQQHLAREPITSIDDASHRTAADWYFEQAFGLCWECDSSQESVDDFVARIEKVSGCSQTRSPVDGKWYLDVANGIYDIGSLPILTDDDILDFQRQPTTPNNAINSVSVKYFDPEKWSDVVTPPVQALALANEFGTIHQDIDHPEIPTAAMALLIASRELLNNVTPTNGFGLKTTRKTFDWRRGTYFRLQSPKRGVADMVCLLGDKDDGTLKSGAIQITAAQDIYSLPAASFVAQEPGVDTRPSPIALMIAQQGAFEAPYFQLVRSMSRADLLALPDDAGFLMTVAQDPATSRDYTIAVSTDGGTTYVNEANGAWCPAAIIVEGDTLQDRAPTTSFTITAGTRLSQVQTGSAAWWDGEIVRVDAIDVNAGTLTVGRGCADTPPVPHAPNTRIWFFDGFAGSANTEYTDGETIDAKLLTNVSGAQLDLAVAQAMTIPMAGRQSRPYPPAQLLVNGDPYPSAANGNLTVTWTHRDRTVQSDQLVDCSAAGVGPETGVTYTVKTYLAGVLVQTIPGISGTSAAPAPGATGPVKIEVEAVRGALTSLLPTSTSFAYDSGLTYRDTVVADGPIRYYRLAEISGTTAADEMGHAAAAIHGSVALNQASINADASPAMRFSGGYVQDTAVLGGGNFQPYSLELWGRADVAPSSGGASFLVVQGNGGSGTNCGINLSDALVPRSDKYPPSARWLSAPAIAVGSSHHFVYTETSTDRYFFCDGVQVAHDTSPEIYSGSTVTTLSVGNTTVGSGSGTVTIKDVAIYDKALTAAQVASHYAAGS